MNFPIKVNIKGKGLETLNKQSYLAAGGEGTVCKKGGTAFKVYHDPKKMIPVQKIKELQTLEGLSNVLGPRDILLDAKGNTPIGFTMPYIPKTEFLCRLFNKNFKHDNGISPEMTVNMVKVMQETLKEIHKNKILVVDFNEMNFLTSSDYNNIYYIDVDSYQTPSYKATALMETIRDRIGTRGQFNEGTDWFSFAVVAFQLYMGYHPYRKGKHSSYKPKDWSKRMDDNVSVFHKDIDLADNWKTWDLIPKAHFDWFQRVFDKKERSIPPLPDGSAFVVVVKPVLVTGNNSFEVTLSKDHREKLLSVYFYNGFKYSITEKSIYSGDMPIYTFKTKPKKLSLANVPGKAPLIVSVEDQEVNFTETNGTKVGYIAASSVMQYKGNIFTLYNGVLTENTFQNFGPKVLHKTKAVCNVFEPATKLYPGVAVQDILGNCWLAVPYLEGFCGNIHIPELDGRRIIDAKFENGVCILISEKDRKYNRAVICFDEKISSYTIRMDDDIAYNGVNFTVKPNGVCIHIPDDNTVEVFKDNTQVKVIDNPPFTTGMRLKNDTIAVYFIDNEKLYTVGLK